MITITREAVEAAVNVANMSAENEDLFFNRLRETEIFTDDEIKSFQIVVAYFKTQMFPERTERIKEAMAEQFYAEFNRKEAN